MSVTLNLPYPPSTNTVYRFTSRGGYITRRGRDYKDAVAIYWVATGHQGFGDARLSVTIELYPPDKRKRDISNTEKLLVDALESAGAFDNDEQIDRLELVRCSRVEGGAVKVRIEAIDGKEIA